jgi:hypothetical protein
MAIKYNPSTKKWSISYGKTNGKIDYQDKKTYSITVKPSSGNYTGVGVVPQTLTFTVDANNSKLTLDQALKKTIDDAIAAGKLPATATVSEGGTTKQKDVSWTVDPTTKPDSEKYQIVSAGISAASELNKKNAESNKTNQARNASYDQALKIINSTQGGDYVAKRDMLRKLPGFDKTTMQTMEDEFKTFYTKEKLKTWDVGLGAKPPYGSFDPQFYKTENPKVAEAWKKAVENDDLDVTGRYNENSYYLYHYTTQGKPAGFRANKAEPLQSSEAYVEKSPTDLEISQVRRAQLGIDEDVTRRDRFLNNPYISGEWEKAKQGDSYWKNLAKDKNLDLNNGQDFIHLFSLSQRNEDKTALFSNNLNLGVNISDLEDAMTKRLGGVALSKLKQVGALTQDAMQFTLDKLKEAKVKENQLATYSKIEGFQEIVDINKNLAKELMGDLSVGGVLPIAGTAKAQTALEKSLEKVTGISGNSLTYNWQQWFDTALKDRYSKDLELGFTKGEAKEKVKVEAEFAKDFVQNYLKPRFDQSKSITEFTDYLELGKNSKNFLELENLISSSKGIAREKAEQYLQQLRDAPQKQFDSEFYFNPAGNKGKEKDYLAQSKAVSDDWESAKSGDPYWKQQAYRFGIDLNDKKAFAKMHYEVKGQGRGYDPAEDILNASKIDDFINETILPLAEDKAFTSRNIFGEFLTPQDVSNQLIKGIGNLDREEVQAVLKELDMEGFAGTPDELKNYIESSFQTDSASDIRKKINALNEIREKPTQRSLGFEYIERPEDYKPASRGSLAETALYKTFKTSGYAGTEDEFYSTLFPDLDKTQQQEATAKAGSSIFDSVFKFGDTKASLKLPELPTAKTKSKTGSSYFKLEDEDSDLASAFSGGSPQGFLNSFLSF